MAAAASQRIGPTAHYTAYVWRRIGLPHAELFATPTGAALYWGFFALGEWTTRLHPAVPSMREYLEYRHRLIDAVVADAQPDRVVELGAGLTRRAVTWAADHGVQAVELDLPEMAALKRAVLSRAPRALQSRLRGLHAVRDADVLASDFASQLVAAIGDARRPVVIAEGLLSYFGRDDRVRILAAVARALAGTKEGSFVCDVHTRAAQAEVGVAAAVLRSVVRALTRRRRALDPFADEHDLHSAFAEAGFRSSDAVLARDFAQADPRLRRLHSPALVIRAVV